MEKSMKWLLVGAIRFYRRLPDRFKRQCLFKENCSCFVERAALETGLLSGLRALKHRVSQCRPRYSVYFDYQFQNFRVCLADGTVEDGSVVADFVLQPYRAGYSAAVFDASNYPTNQVRFTRN